MKLSKFLKSKEGKNLKRYADASREVYAFLNIDPKNASYDPKNKKFTFELRVPKRVQAYTNLSHGGIVAAWLDSGVGVLSLLESLKENKFALTKKLDIEFLKPILVDDRIIVESKVTNVKNRVISVKAKIFLRNKPRYIMAEAKAIMVKIENKKI